MRIHALVPISPAHLHIFSFARLGRRRAGRYLLASLPSHHASSVSSAFSTLQALVLLAPTLLYSIAYALHRTKLHSSITFSDRHRRSRGTRHHPPYPTRPYSIAYALHRTVAIHHILLDHHDLRLMQPRTPIDWSARETHEGKEGWRSAERSGEEWGDWWRCAHSSMVRVFCHQQPHILTHTLSTLSLPLVTSSSARLPSSSCHCVVAW